MTFTKPQVYTFLKYLAFSIVLILCTIIYNVFSSAYQTVQKERMAEKLETVNTVAYRDTVDGVDWYTYRNDYYGYEISYPESVELIRSSEAEMFSNLPDSEKDPLINLKTKDQQFQMFTIGIGSNRNFTVDTQQELYDFYDLIGINDLIKYHRNIGYDLSKDDFKMEKINFQSREAIAITDPATYRIITFNSKGEIFFVNALDYDNSLDTEKDRNTRAIMETFRVLD